MQLKGLLQILYNVMKEPAIVVENLSKCYQIGKAKSADLRSAIDNVFRTLVKGNRQETVDFWALKDINFEIEQGEAVAIIGRNGAGKSTLLKILSRITYPSSGRATINGHVASLLEVGTGFHAELTGRENIYMNGSILGMKRAYIKKKFDEIVDFSGIEKFIDTPVKRYSSGMYVRLAFAVAAHLEPEILIVDEVLAVGDTEFQKKCIGKMEDVGRDGRTILFVSHNMEAVIRLCTKGILLRSGQIHKIGTSRDVVNEYFRLNEDLIHTTKIGERTDRWGSGRCKFVNAWLTNDKGEEVFQVHSGETIQFHVEVEPKPDYTDGSYYVAIAIGDTKGNRLLGLASGFLNKKVKVSKKTEIIWTVPKFPLAADEYYCNLIMFEGHRGADMSDFLEQAFKINVEEGDYFGTGMIQAKGVDRLFTEFTMQTREL